MEAATDAGQWLAEHHGLHLSIEGVRYWQKSRGVLERPRRTHTRKDAERSEAFRTQLAR